MNKTHNNFINNVFVPEKEQGIFLCQPSQPKPTLSIETLDALEGLGSVLRRIQKRMTKEGYEIVNGKVCKINA